MKEGDQLTTSNQKDGNLNQINSYIKYLILGMVIVCLIVFSITFYIGKSENMDSKNDFDSYSNAVQLINSNQTEQAILQLKVLIEKYPNNSYITRMLGIAYSSSGDFKLASYYCQESLKLHPTLQLDIDFMVQYGEILYFNGEYKKAKVFLDHALKLSEARSHKKEINNILLKIQRKNNG
jgi:tetratricopeptide (TPR) repeat protein